MKKDDLKVAWTIDDEHAPRVLDAVLAGAVGLRVDGCEIEHYARFVPADPCAAAYDDAPPYVNMIEYGRVVWDLNDAGERRNAAQALATDRACVRVTDRHHAKVQFLSHSAGEWTLAVNGRREIVVDVFHRVVTIAENVGRRAVYDTRYPWAHPHESLCAFVARAAADAVSRAGDARDALGEAATKTEALRALGGLIGAYADRRDKNA